MEETPDFDIEFEVLETKPVKVTEIKESDLKVFYCTSDLLIMDENSRRFGIDLSEAKLKVANPTSVTDTSGKLIGTANVYLDGRTVFAEIYIDYHTPERLDIQAGKSVFAIANHSVMLNGGYTNRNVGKSVEITNISLSLERNVDERVQPIR